MALGFVGRRKKAAFFTHFVNAQQRDQYAENWLSEQEKEAKAAKARKAFEHTLKVGDILYSSWGYDQTNIDFYEVVETKGKKTVVLRRRNVCRGPEKEFMTADVMAGPGFMTDKTQSYRVTEGNWVRLNSYSGAGPWDGKARRISWYA